MKIVKKFRISPWKTVLKKSLISTIFTIGLLTLPASSWANNLSISNVSLETRNINDNSVVVEFDISWDNSWRNTENYDAVWVVFKVTVGSSVLPTTVIWSGTDPTGTSPGSNKDLEIYVPSDVAGAFIQRKSTGSGTVTSKDMQIMVATNAADSSDISITIYGVEMVYIPQGPFYVGDVGASDAAFRQGSTDADPWYIESEATIRTTNTSGGSFYYVSDSETNEFATGDIFTIIAEYPKGYAAFYCMKYPITEGQYVDFLNNIDSLSASNRDITSSGSSGKNSDSVVRRNTVSYTGAGTGTTARPDRAMSYLSYPDLAAWLDWMALRPMTELEYEKVARGPLAAVTQEYAWGKSEESETPATAGVTFAGSPEDGNETFSLPTTANAVFDSHTFSQGDDFLGSDHVKGPVRPGIFAKTNTGRAVAAAGYYGVMDLSGNLRERTVTVGNTWGIVYWGVHGDGTLNADDADEGNARQLGWVGHPDDGAIGVSESDGVGFRGGSWSQPATRLRVSDRSQASNLSNTRSNNRGGRGVRSISPPTLPTCGNSTVEFPEQCEVDVPSNCNSNACDTDCLCLETVVEP